jgi:hypothetical protein
MIATPHGIDEPSRQLPVTLRPPAPLASAERETDGRRPFAAHDDRLMRGRLAAAPTRRAGIASGVNTAISRLAGLLAVAVIPGVTGLTGNAYHEPAVFASGFQAAMRVSAALVAGGGLLAWLLIRNQIGGRADGNVSPYGLGIGFDALCRYSFT